MQFGRILLHLAGHPFPWPTPPTKVNIKKLMWFCMICSWLWRHDWLTVIFMNGGSVWFDAVIDMKVVVDMTLYSTNNYIYEVSWGFSIVAYLASDEMCIWVLHGHPQKQWRNQCNKCCNEQKEVPLLLPFMLYRFHSTFHLLILLPFFEFGAVPHPEASPWDCDSNWLLLKDSILAPIRAS